MRTLTILLLAILPCPLLGQFSGRQQLTDSEEISYLPYTNSKAMAANGQYVHIVYTDRREGPGEVYYRRSINGGISWEAERRLTADDNLFSGRAAIVSSQDVLHLIWMDLRDGNYELYYKRSVNNGTNWSTDMRLTNDGGSSEFPSVTLLQNTIHLAWNDDRHGNDEIFYKRSTDAGMSWTADTRVTNHAGDSYKPSIAVSDSLIQIIWEDLRNGKSEIFYNRSENAGATWGSDIRLSNSTAECYAPCLSSNGRVAFATWDDHRTGHSQVFYRRTIDGGLTWGNALNLSLSDTDAYNAHHAISGTYMCISYTQINGPDPDILFTFSTDAGLTWSGFTKVLNMNFSIADNSFVFISGDMVHTAHQDDVFGNFEIFYERNPFGNPLHHEHSPIWTQQVGSPQHDRATSMVVDEHNNIYVTGRFSGTIDFDPGPNLYELSAAGSTDVFVYKVNAGGSLVWAKRIGSTEQESAYDIALDQNGNVVIAGAFPSAMDFDPGDGVVTVGAYGQVDIFVLKLTENGSFVWVRRMGGDGTEEPRAVAITSANDILVTGYYTEKCDFDPGPNNAFQTSSGAEDIFILSLDEQGEHQWSHSLGSIGYDTGNDLTVDPAGNVTLTGAFSDTVDFDPGPNVVSLISDGLKEIFLLQLSEAGAYQWAYHFGDELEDEGIAITTDAAGNIYTTGYFSENVDFDPHGFDLLQAGEIPDMYVSSFLPDGHFRWAHNFGGGFSNGPEKGNAITVHNGAVYATGEFDSQVNFSTDHRERGLVATGGSDIVILKMNAETGQQQWLNQFGGNFHDVPLSIVAAPYGRIGVCGYFSGIGDFSPSIDQRRLSAVGIEDGFVTVFRECEPSYSTTEVTACSVYQFSPDSAITQSGVYTRIIESASGCDSIITLTLHLIGPDTTDVTDAACESFTTPSGNVITDSGTYPEILIAANGCDSVVVYHITIGSTTYSTIEVAACEQYTDQQGHTLKTTGEYAYFHTNSEGCDSVHTLLLTIGHPSVQTFDVEACDAFTEGDSTWYESGFYTYTHITEAGCDSVLQFDVSVYNYNTTVIETDTGLLAENGIPGLNIWVDCNTNFTPVPGESGNLFSPDISGSYAVLIGEGACYDTSACYNVTIVSLADTERLQDVKVFPNPTTGEIQVVIPPSLPDVQLDLFDTTGSKINAATRRHGGNTTLEINAPQGMYYLFIKTAASTRCVKIVKM